MSNAVGAVSPQTVLWSTVETFTAVTGYAPEQYPPATSDRIQQQVNAVRPYVSDFVSYIYGDDFSQMATYFPVEASVLNRAYQARSRPTTTPNVPVIAVSSYQSVPAPSPYYPDSGSHLINGTGGGYDNYGLTDWSGYAVGDDGGTVTITADLGFARPITAMRTLTLSMTNSGIYHPAGISVSVSSDGTNFTRLGSPGTIPGPDTYDFSVGWSELDTNTNARYVRWTFTHQEWFFISEIQVLGPPAVPPPAGTVSVSMTPNPAPPLMVGQTQQFQAAVTGSSNTGVTWSVVQGAGASYGTISQTGLYTAPSSVPEAITVGVQAASTANATAVAETSFTVSPSSVTQQMVGPVTPNGGTGNKQLFSFQATPVSGSLAWVQMLFGETLSPTSACLVYYDPPSQTIRLSANDSIASYNDWVNQPVVLGTPGTVIANSQCSVDVGNSSVTGSASTALHINLSVTFLGPWSGSLQYIFMAAEDSAGNQTDWPIVGTWSIP